MTGVDVGIVTSIENNHKEVKTAKKSSAVAIKISPLEGYVLYTNSVILI
jgi:hypothetical protein